MAADVSPILGERSIRRRILRGVAIAVGIGITIVIALSFSRVGTARIDLLAHFRMPLAWLALVAVLLAAVAKTKKTLVLVGIALLCDAAPIASHTLLGDSATPTGDTLRVLQWNVWWRNPKLDEAFAFVASDPAPIIALEEAPRSLVERLVNEAGLTLLASDLTDDPDRKAGTALFVRASDHLVAFPGDVLRRSGRTSGGGIARGRVEWRPMPKDSIAIELLAAHVPPPNDASSVRVRSQWFAMLLRAIDDARGDVIFLGDLNSTPFSSEFESLLNVGLRDASAGFLLEPTWPSAATGSWRRLVAVPIDHVLYGKGLCAVEHRVLAESHGSDHQPVAVILGLVLSR